MSKQTTRSHYLPRTYLKHFLFDEELVVYQKGEKFFKEIDKTPEQRIFVVKGEEGLKNIGLQNHLYNPMVEGISSNEVEEIFGEYGEYFYNEVISEIENMPTGSAVPQEIKDKLSLMFSAMRVRTPLFKSEVEEMDRNFRKHFMSKNISRMSPEDLVKHYKEINGKDISLKTATRIHKTFTEKDYELKYPNGFFIKIALTSLEKHADIFHQMTWNFYKSENRYFITSDNPLTYFVPREYLNAYTSPKSLTNKYCEVFFPLTKTLGAHLSWRKESETQNTANRETVENFNFNISRQSLDYLFSPIRMNSLKEFVQTYIPYPFKFTIH